MEIHKTRILFTMNLCLTNLMGFLLIKRKNNYKIKIHLLRNLKFNKLPFL